MLSGLFCLLLSNGVLADTFTDTCERNPSFEDSGPLVKTNNGFVLGKYENAFDSDVATFLGIPFGKPPVGEKRFQPPEPVDAWIGVKMATEKPNTCHQFSSRNTTDFPWIPKESEGKRSEDCLYLNLWSPSKCRQHSARKLPVLVWILPGGFSSGSSSMDLYDGRVLAAKGDVVVVTFNYRVGLFGFLSAGTKEAPGNAGFHDQLLALEWVKENVGKFGGDPDNITIFGESAGSISISLHLVSPLSKNLFNRAIMMSGTSYQPFLTDNHSMGLLKLNLFAGAAGCTNQTEDVASGISQVVKCLKDKDPVELSHVEDAFVSRFPTLFLPVYGNDVFPRSPINSMNDGEINQMEVLMGTVKDEGSIFLNYVAPDVFPINVDPSLTNEQFSPVVSTFMPMTTVLSHKDVSNFYLQDTSEPNSDSLVKAISNYMADYLFECPSMFLAEKLNSVYVYYNTHRSQKDFKAEWMGQSHFFDVAYVFGVPLLDQEHYSPEDKKFSEDIIQKWVSFARSGNPVHPESKESWPLFTASDRLVRELNPKDESNIQFPRTQSCDFLRPFFKSLPAHAEPSPEASSVKS